MNQKKPPSLWKQRRGLLSVKYSIFNREAGGRAAPVRACSEVVLMSTYEELQLIVSVAVLIVAILDYTHKK